MSNIVLITMFAMAASVSAKPYFPGLPARSIYGSILPSSYASTVVQNGIPALIQEPVPAVVPGTFPAVLPGTVPATINAAAAYTAPELANYAYGDYSSLYGLPNYAASPYTLPQYGYTFGNYLYKR